MSSFFKWLHKIFHSCENNATDAGTTDDMWSTKFWHRCTIVAKNGLLAH